MLLARNQADLQMSGEKQRYGFCEFGSAIQIDYLRARLVELLVPQNGPDSFVRLDVIYALRGRVPLALPSCRFREGSGKLGLHVPEGSRSVHIYASIFCPIQVIQQCVMLRKTYRIHVVIHAQKRIVALLHGTVL